MPPISFALNYRKLSVICLMALPMLFSGCAALKKQLGELQNFSKCQFRIRQVANIQLAGVNVQNIRRVTDLNLSQAASLGAAYLQKSMPLAFDLNVQGRNPTSGNAALNGFDYVLLIDGQEMLRGSQPQRFSMSPNGTAEVPMRIQLDVFRLLSGKSKDALINFGLALANQNGEPARVKLRFKPYFVIAGQNYPWPSFIEIGKDFKSLN